MATTVPSPPTTDGSDAAESAEAAARPGPIGGGATAARIILGPDSGFNDTAMGAGRVVGGISPLRAAVLSTFVPGLGHLGSGRRRGWLIMAAVVLAAILGAVLIATSTRAEAASWLVRPDWLRVAIMASVVSVVIRCLVIFDAVRLADGPDRTGRWSTLAGALAVAVALAAPHIIATYYLTVQFDVVTGVFTAQRTETALPGPLPADSPRDRPALEEPVTIPTSPVDEPLSPTTSQTTTVTTTPPSTAPPVQTWDGEQRLTIALLGGDGGFDRIGVRTDTIIVLSIDVETGDAATFSVPRNWQGVQFPDGSRAAAAYPRGFDDLVNAVYGLGTRRPDLFPDSDYPGGAAIKQALAQALGIPIQYFVLVDMVAVVDTIDLFGGLDVTVTEYVNDRIRPIESGGPWLVIDTAPGEYRFDGLTTLAYVRSRRQSSDYNRILRQRCVLGDVIEQVSVLDLLRNYEDLADIITAHVETDVPLDRADDLLEIVGRLDPERIGTVTFVPPDYPTGVIPYARVRDDVSRTLADLGDTSLPDDDPQAAVLAGACDLDP